MIVHFHALFQQARNKWRDHILTALTLTLVLHLFVVTPLSSHPGATFTTLNAVLAIVLAGGLLTLARNWIAVTLLLLFVGLFALSHVLQGYSISDMEIVRIRAGAWLLMALAMAWIIARAVFARGQITYHRVVGAVFLYLCIGIFFAALYAMGASLTVNALSGITIRPHASLATEAVYFSFVTLTSVGYGDIAPIDPLLRGLANFEAIVGQLYPATLLARLVASEVRIGGPGSS